MLQRIFWSEAARADIRGLDRTIAMRILHSLDEYLATGQGDVVRLVGRDAEFRLRVGNQRVCFTKEGEVIHIHWVRHRSVAYR